MADAPELGSGVLGRGGSSPFSRTILKFNKMRKQLSGRASPCQGEGREFESRFPLQKFFCLTKWSGFCFAMVYGKMVEYGTWGIFDFEWVRIYPTRRFYEEAY